VEDLENASKRCSWKRIYNLLGHSKTDFSQTRKINLGKDADFDKIEE